MTKPITSISLEQARELRMREACPVCASPIDALVVNEAECRVEIMHTIAPIASAVCRMRLENPDEE